MIAPSRHQLVLEQKAGTDFERLEDIGASAIAAARHAVARSQALDGETAYALRRELAELRKIAEERSGLRVHADEAAAAHADERSRCELLLGGGVTVSDGAVGREHERRGRQRFEHGA